MATAKTLHSISTAVSLRHKCRSYYVINLEMFADYPLMISSELTLLNFHISIQLFHFDVHEDVRTIADATIEKDEVHFLLSHCDHLFEIQVYKIVKTRLTHVCPCVF